MKKLFAAILIFMICLCSCAGKDNNTDAKVDVCMGYSMEQFGLKLTEGTGLAVQQMKYNDTVNVNGNYSEVYDKTGDGDVSLLTLQGFYKEDLKSKQIFINSRTFTEKQMESFLVYEDDKIAVYDISYFIYHDTVSERLDNYGIYDFKSVDCAVNVKDYIVQKSPGQARPPKTHQNTKDAQKIHVTL